MTGNVSLSFSFFFASLKLHLAVTSLGCFLQYNGVFTYISAHTLDFSKLACFGACALNFTCVFLCSLFKNPESEK